VSRYQKGKTNVDFTDARDSEWQWNPLGHMQVCTLLLTDNHASTSPLSFLQAGCPSCHPTNSVKALKAQGSGISWAVCKSASRSRQITMPAAHYAVFYSPDALPAAQPTASKH